MACQSRDIAKLGLHICSSLSCIQQFAKDFSLEQVVHSMIGFYLLIWIFIMCLKTRAMQTEVMYQFDFKCGHQPVTGELSVEKGFIVRGHRLFSQLDLLGEVELFKIDMGRRPLNKFEDTHTYTDFPHGPFKLMLKTGCGALSEIGQVS